MRKVVQGSLGIKPEQEKQEQVKAILALKEAREKAKRFLHYLKKERPRDAKVDLLPYALRVGGLLAAKILAEEVDRQKLREKDRIWFEKFKKEFLFPKEASSFNV